MFQKAQKTQARLRLALIGPSGSGKTFTALTFAQRLGQRIAVIDTEHGSSQKYADRFAFDVAVLNRHHPREYVKAIKTAATAGYDVLIIDSLSHAWIGREGALELVDRARKGSRGNDFTVWADITPLHNELLDTILGAPLHIIATLRTKTAYEIEKDERTGKSTITKLGLQPIQRDGMEYEFDIIADMTLDNTLIVTKSRMETLSGRVIEKPGNEVADEIATWLTEGAPAPDASFAPANGTGGFEKSKLIARIQELAAEASRLGISFDLTDLEAEPEAELLRIGQSLRARIDQATAQQEPAKEGSNG
jgi:hypothetical protein